MKRYLIIIIGCLGIILFGENISVRSTIYMNGSTTNIISVQSEINVPRFNVPKFKTSAEVEKEILYKFNEQEWKINHSKKYNKKYYMITYDNKTIELGSRVAAKLMTDCPDKYRSDDNLVDDNILLRRLDLISYGEFNYLIVEHNLNMNDSLRENTDTLRLLLANWVTLNNTPGKLYIKYFNNYGHKK